jgi:hypothetical protein
MKLLIFLHRYTFQKGARCCQIHLEEKKFLTVEAINSLVAVSNQVKLDAKSIELLDCLRIFATKNKFLGQFGNEFPLRSLVKAFH